VITDAVALVTGGASGIGKATATLLAHAGYAVVIADVDAQRGADSAHDLQQQGHRASFEQVDIGIPSEARDLPKRAVGKFSQLDVLVNAAGMTTNETIFEITEDSWSRILGVNLSGMYFCTEAAARVMRDSGRGRVVSISSIAGKGFPTLNPAYAAAKAGVIAMTRYFANELGPFGITVNAICPGLTRTPMLERSMRDRAARAGTSVEQLTDATVARIPMRRENQARDIASAVAFLVSDEARNVNGQSLNVDGGLVWD
jgi:3-oxoacyl-[acyl-carrier protein] reductase